MYVSSQLSFFCALFQQLFAFKYRLAVYLLRYIEVERGIDINGFDVGSKNKLRMFSYDITVPDQIFF